MMFSIICAVYNHERFISECIDSIIFQTYQNWEMIILNDGSTDKTELKILPYLSDKRIKYFYQENKGAERLAENYNFMVEKSTGDFLTILEGDDYVDSVLLEKHLISFQDKKCILSYSQVIVKEQNYEWISPIPRNELERQVLNNSPVGNAYHLLLNRCFIPAQGTTVRSEILKGVGGFVSVPNLPTVDHPTWIKIAKLGEFKLIELPLSVWRRHETQTTKQRLVQLTELMFGYVEQWMNVENEFYCNQINISKKSVLKIWKRQLIINYVRAGKYKLLVGEWKQGRSYYFKSFRNWNSFLPVWRTKALLGILFSFLHLNVEWFSWFVPNKKGA